MESTTAKSYILSSSAEDLNFKSHLNHEVTVTGSADQKMGASASSTTASTQVSEEKDMPKLTAKSITMVSDRCTPSSK